GMPGVTGAAFRPQGVGPDKGHIMGPRRDVESAQHKTIACLHLAYSTVAAICHPDVGSVKSHKRGEAEAARTEGRGEVRGVPAQDGDGVEVHRATSRNERVRSVWTCAR